MFSFFDFPDSSTHFLPVDFNEGDELRNKDGLEVGLLDGTEEKITDGINEGTLLDLILGDNDNDNTLGTLLSSEDGSALDTLLGLSLSD